MPTAPTPLPQDLTEADLLSDEEWSQEMHRYILGSFPLGWDVARRKLLRDRQMRTTLMRKDDNESMYESALGPEDDLLGLLSEAVQQLPEGELACRIKDALKIYGVQHG